MPTLKFKNPETGEWEHVGFPKSGVQMDLLWQNASPTSDFAAQTINLDLTDYPFVCFSYMAYKTAANQIESFSTWAVPSSIGGSANAADTRYRCMTAKLSSVTFSDSAYVGTLTTIENGYRIPYRIYGIKGVTIT